MNLHLNNIPLKEYYKVGFESEYVDNKEDLTESSSTKTSKSEGLRTARDDPSTKSEAQKTAREPSARIRAGTEVRMDNDEGYTQFPDDYDGLDESSRKYLEEHPDLLKPTQKKRDAIRKFFHENYPGLTDDEDVDEQGLNESGLDD